MQQHSNEINLEKHGAVTLFNIRGDLTSFTEPVTMTVADGWTRTTGFVPFANASVTGKSEWRIRTSNPRIISSLLYPFELIQPWCLSCHDSLGTHRAMGSVSAPAGLGTRGL